MFFLGLLFSRLPRRWRLLSKRPVLDVLPRREKNPCLCKLTKFSQQAIIGSNRSDPTDWTDPIGRATHLTQQTEPSRPNRPTRLADLADPTDRPDPTDRADRKKNKRSILTTGIAHRCMYTHCDANKSKSSVRTDRPD